MGIFDTWSEPIFLKEESAAQKRLEELENLTSRVAETDRERLEKDIRNLRSGITGETNILFELKNSHMPLYVLHDLYFKQGDLTAQIDFYIITPKINFILECKNLYGNIQITQDGRFIRKQYYGKQYSMEGIYSPVTQNERHLELIRQIKGKELGAIKRMLFEKKFYDTHRSLIVLANPKTLLNDKDAPEEIRNQVIRADQLIRYLKTANEQSRQAALSAAEMEKAARFLLSLHEDPETDYAKSYQLAPPKRGGTAQVKSGTDKSDGEKTEPAIEEEQDMICPLCKGKLKICKGRFGPFIGCSNFSNGCTYTRKLPARKR